MGFFLDDSDNPKWGNLGCLVVAVLLVGPAACGIYSTFSNTTGAVTSAPGRVVQRTLQTDNIIQNYEGFFDRKAAYDARLAQVREQRAVLASETDPAEKVQLRTELSTMRMSCREIAASYNADSEKQNRAVFKSRGLPPTLSLEDCDA